MNRKPTALRILQGNPGKRPLNKCEPQPAQASGRMPADLPKEARPYWRKLAPKLRRVGLLTELDVPALADLCLCLARARQAEDLVTSKGVLVAGDRGMVKNPAIQVARDYRAAAARLMARFGMTPSDRSGLAMRPAEEADPLQAFLKAANR
jgi:P27 family predicted phage terminase small subunit